MISVDATYPSVTLQTGEVIYADLVIGADGVKSIVREAVLGGPSKPVPTGDAAYRAVIPTNSMLSDPDLKVLVDTPEFQTWMGPDRHIVGYNIVSFQIVICEDPEFQLPIFSRALKRHTI